MIHIQKASKNELISGVWKISVSWYYRNHDLVHAEKFRHCEVYNSLDLNL